MALNLFELQAVVLEKGGVRSAAKSLGISKTTLNDIIGGRVKPNDRTLANLSKAFADLPTSERRFIRKGGRLLETMPGNMRDALTQSRKRNRGEIFRERVKRPPENPDEIDFKALRADYKMLRELGDVQTLNKLYPKGINPAKPRKVIRAKAIKKGKRKKA